MKALIILVFYFLIYVLLALIVIGLGVGTGAVLHRMMRGVEYGTCMILGFITTGIALHFYVRLMTKIHARPQGHADDEVDEISRKLLDALDPETGRQRRKWKKT